MIARTHVFSTGSAIPSSTSATLHKLAPDCRPRDTHSRGILPFSDLPETLIALLGSHWANVEVQCIELFVHDKGQDQLMRFAE